MGDNESNGCSKMAATANIPKSFNDIDEEMKAQVDIWRYIFGFTEMAVVKCAIELGIPDLLETRTHDAPMSLQQLSSALGCSSPYLHRIMRFLTNRNIFKEVTPSNYAQTPLSRLLVRNGEKSMAALFMLESSHVMLKAWHGLHDRVLINGPPAFEAAHGDDIWDYAETNLVHSKLINDAMACDARVCVPAIIQGCPEVFAGIQTLVDVGGGDGTALGILVKGFPWIHGINFDVTHVVSVAKEYEGVEHIAGNMFVSVPKADAVFIKWVLHDWDDEDCIQILKRCKEAIPQDKGKVIIVEAVIGGGGGDDGAGGGGGDNEKLKDVGLMLDMVMMAHTGKGKERTWEEWVYVLNEAGFSTYSLKPIPTAVQSLIEAYP